jgi:hypothetical protein
VIRRGEQDGDDDLSEASSVADIQNRRECLSVRGTRQGSAHTRGVGWKYRVVFE